MTRSEVFARVKAHLADELRLDPETIRDQTRFREDLGTDSLDLYTLLQELEDVYGLKIPDEQAVGIETVGDAVDFVVSVAAGGTNGG